MLSILSPLLDLLNEKFDHRWQIDRVYADDVEQCFLYLKQKQEFGSILAIEISHRTGDLQVWDGPDRILSMSLDDPQSVDKLIIALDAIIDNHAEHPSQVNIE